MNRSRINSADCNSDASSSTDPAVSGYVSDLEGVYVIATQSTSPLLSLSLSLSLSHLCSRSLFLSPSFSLPLSPPLLSLSLTHHFSVITALSLRPCSSKPPSPTSFHPYLFLIYLNNCSPSLDSERTQDRSANDLNGLVDAADKVFISLTLLFLSAIWQTNSSQLNSRCLFLQLHLDSVKDEPPPTSTVVKEALRLSYSYLNPPPYVAPQACSILSCLKQFTSPELLTGSNKFACSFCNKKAKSSNPRGGNHHAPVLLSSVGAVSTG